MKCSCFIRSYLPYSNPEIKFIGLKLFAVINLLLLTSFRARPLYNSFLNGTLHKLNHKTNLWTNRN